MKRIEKNKQMKMKTRTKRIVMMTLKLCLVMKKKDESIFWIE